MGVRAKDAWITGAEYGRLRWELIQRGVPDDNPEFLALRKRVQDRDEELWELYGKPYMQSHPNKWIAISIDGRVLIRDTASELVWAGAREFGEGNFASRKLADFPGHRFHA